MFNRLQIISVILFTITFSYLATAYKKEPEQITKQHGDYLPRNIIQKWEFELDDKLVYPRGDKEKLKRISALWSEYYSCSERLVRSVTSSGRLPGVCRGAWERGASRLPCGLCVAPGEPAVTWMYSQFSKASFSPLEYDERVLVSGDGDLTINGVRRGDEGVYKCTMGQSSGGVVILEVLDRNEPYDVVKPPTSHGPYPTPPHNFGHNGVSLSAFTSWSAWSECSACGRVGRRRRYGTCYVKGTPTKGENKTTSKRKEDMRTSKNLLKLFEEFPAGLPCRSRLLPKHLAMLPFIARRRNEIIIGLCKVPCEKGSTFEVRSSSGALLERANNALGVYSLSQRIPIEPPAPVFETVFAALGKRLVLICPGFPLRDMPVNWRVGTKVLSPRDVDKSSGGRVHLNARDGLVFTVVQYGDANVYSCWQRDALVGSVKMEVWDPHPYWGQRAMLLATLLVAALVLRQCDAVLRNKRRRGP